MEKIIKRHAGVLGLCAYVQAYPYDVPDFMPQILMDLSSHVNDPQPIQVCPLLLDTHTSGLLYWNKMPEPPVKSFYEKFLLNTTLKQT